MVTIAYPTLPEGGRLVCGPMPRRPFPQAVAELVEAGIGVVACLLEDREFPRELVEAYTAAGLEVVRFPLPDYGPPADVDAASAFVTDLLRRLHDRQAVYLHCFAGVGRTGTVLACLLKSSGAPGDPVRLVREIYDRRAVESGEQQRFVRHFAPRTP